MATTRTTKPKPAAKTAKAVPPSATAADAAPPAKKAPARKPRAKAVPPVAAEPVTPVAAVEAATEAATPVVEAVAEKIETTAAEAPPLVEAAVEPVAKAVTTVKETAVKAVKSAETSALKAAKAGKATAEKAVKAGTEKITKTFEQAFATSKEKYETVMQNFSDISAIGRENMDAVVSAGTVFAKGIEAVNAELAAISKRNLEDSIAAVKALAAAKSAKEYLELQSDLMKTSWDHMVADTTKIGEMMGEYSKDAMAPIQSRITATMEKFSKPLTA
ncbi:MAG: TIGR01841 family phasin [Sphingomonadales bacterium]